MFKPCYPDPIPGVPEHVRETANTSFFEPRICSPKGINFKAVTEIFDAQARIELQKLVNANPGKDVHWPEIYPVCGKVYPK